MNTSLATKEIRLQEWTTIIQDQKSSGLIVDDYCKQHGLSRNSFYYWLRKVKEAALKASGIEFIELPVTNEEPSDKLSSCGSSFSPEAVIRTNNLSIEICSSISKELLQMLCEVAANAK